MGQQLTPHRGKAVLGLENGKYRALKPQHLDGDAVLREGQKTVIFEKQVPADKLAWWGYGYEDLPGGAKRMHFDLVDANGDPVEADLIIRITDSSGDTTHADRSLGDAATLREMVDQERTEREEMPAMDPHAKGHRQLQIVAVADAASDGVSIDPSASTGRFWYTQTR